jgi:hypothetical protein
MARRAAAVDANQSEIVEALRKAGASVQPLHSVGMGCPDLLVGFRGTNLLMEVKDGDKVPSARKLTEWQEKWHMVWEGQVCTVNNVEDALAVLFEAPQEIPFHGMIM